MYAKIMSLVLRIYFGRQPVENLLRMEGGSNS